MRRRRASILVWLLLIAAALAWNVYAHVNRDSLDRLSEVLLWASGRYPIIPLVIGILLGHLFWPQHPQPRGGR